MKLFVESTRRMNEKDDLAAAIEVLDQHFEVQIHLQTWWRKVRAAARVSRRNSERAIAIHSHVAKAMDELARGRAEVESLDDGDIDTSRFGRVVGDGK